jgi:antitoxin ParD1/3/4
MSRQSISINAPNSEWLKTKVEIEGEYSSNSEAINDLIRRAREREKQSIEAVRNALLVGEQSGISDRSLADVIRDVEGKYLK